MSLDKLLSRTLSAVPDCVAAGYVMLGDGLLLGAKTIESHPGVVLDVVAAATADLFQGSNVVAIEVMFNRSRGLKEPQSHYFQEIIINIDNLVHIFLRVKTHQIHVLVIVCKRNVSLGMALLKARNCLLQVEKVFNHD